MRHMSFSLTTAQYEDRTKDVTRRLGWNDMLPGDVFMGVVKGMGLKKGEKVQRLHAAKCVSIRPEKLRAMIDLKVYGRREVIREGFPHLTPAEFVAMFCNHNHCTPDALVNRIEFKHLDTEPRFVFKRLVSPGKPPTSREYPRVKP